MSNPIRIIDDVQAINKVGSVILQYETYQNSFVNALVNRIGMAIVTSKTWDNPWARFKQGTLELGETVEEIFANVVKSHSYDPHEAESHWMAREMPDVRAAFHTMNFQKYYKLTIQEYELRQAFIAWSEMTDLIARMTGALYTSLNLDEFTMMKYMMCRAILNAELYYETVTAQSSDPKDAVKKMRANSRKLTYLTNNYNQAGVYNATDYRDQYIFIDADYESVMDVEVLAAAFNMEKAEFIGHLIVVDSFSEHDEERLKMLFNEIDNAEYVPFTSAEKTSLGKIAGVTVGARWWMVFDVMQTMRQQNNGEGLYWNYWLHTWKIFSISPFENAIVYTSETGSITAVSLSPATANMYPGSSIQFTPTVTKSGIIDTKVKYEISGQKKAGTKINTNGVLYLDPEETGTVADNETNGTITVTCTSLADATAYDTSTVTVINS